MKAFLSAVAIALISFSSCTNYKDIQDPQFRDIRGAHIKDVGLLKTTANVDLVFFNPNDYGVQLTTARGDVYIDGSFFGHFDLDTKVSVKKRSEFILPVTFKLDNIGAIANQQDIYKKKEARVRIDGMARVAKNGFSKEIPIVYERVQNIEKLRELVTR
jgi:LEA14-like dessication related protein